MEASIRQAVTNDIAALRALIDASVRGLQARKTRRLDSPCSTTVRST